MPDAQNDVDACEVSEVPQCHTPSAISLTSHVSGSSERQTKNAQENVDALEVSDIAQCHTPSCLSGARKTSGYDDTSLM